ncbi:magnesium transporter MRS2-4 isoform X2 [Tripterygium wilfordii]|uniref:Magnesium transporter MRS2-4 isoform X2 n=1 Tax=Tripterygium wilfordii TaxID=458696 RepID=A0A7J7DD47_TRIWF|nr:magnesium transporter MRS2-4 isoform X2 [Tripterygium wilfordii]
MRETERDVADSSPTAAGLPSSKGKKKAGGVRLWMSIKRNGELIVKEYEKSEIIKWATIPYRDLRIFCPVFSDSSNILGREKAMVVNLDFIMALDASVEELERDAYPILDDLARNVSTKNLELVRSLKSKVTRLLARVQKVIEFLLAADLWNSAQLVKKDIYYY